MSALAPNPQTETGVGGAAPPVAGDDFSQYYLPQQMSFPSGAPPGAYTDAQYIAAEAQNRFNVAQQYAAELAQLGYTDPNTGAYIPGNLVTSARLAEQQAQQGMQQADLQNTQQMQQAGTLFSGMRGQQQAQAEAPFLTQIGQTELQLPQDMATHYATAAGLIGAYNTQNLSDLAAAAQRATANIDQTPTGGGTTTTPPAQTTPPPSGPAGSATNPADTSNAFPYGPAPPGTAIAMAGGGEVSQPTNALIGEQGPEVVVPRANLDPVGNAALDRVAQAAGVSTAGYPPPRSPIAPGDTEPLPGIHSFGPGGPIQITPGLPGHLPIPGPPVHPAQALQDLGRHAAAVQLYLQHHPGAVAGHATGVPGWAQAAVAARLRASIPEHAFAAV